MRYPAEGYPFLYIWKRHGRHIIEVMQAYPRRYYYLGPNDDPAYSTWNARWFLTEDLALLHCKTLDPWLIEQRL